MSKEAMKLALEAMKRIQNADMDCDFLNVRQADQLDEAITALREALAEQPAQQEPVAWGNFKEDGTLVGLSQHPEDQANWTGRKPLYTSPPAQRKPLTDDEIDRLWSQSLADTEGETWLPLREFARAIEAAHNIKENT